MRTKVGVAIKQLTMVRALPGGQTVLSTPHELAHLIFTQLQVVHTMQIVLMLHMCIPDTKVKGQQERP